MPDELDHEPTLAFDGGADGGFSASSGFGGIRGAGEMSGGALGVTKFDTAAFQPELFLHDIFQMFGSAREHRMSEGIQTRAIGRDFLSSQIL